MEKATKAQTAVKEQAAQEFVRTVLVSTFKQRADGDTVKNVAKRVLSELAASPEKKRSEA